MGKHKNQHDALKKEYSCALEVQFPETDEQKQNILESIEAVLEEIKLSHVDLDYLTSIVLDEHSEEVIFLDFLLLHCCQ